MKKKLLILLLMTGAIVPGVAQLEPLDPMSVEVTGPNTAFTNEAKQYDVVWRSLTPTIKIIAAPPGTVTWSVNPNTGGIITNSSNTRATVQWTSPGTHRVDFEHVSWEGYYTSYLLVTVSLGPPATPNPTFSLTQSCGTTIVQRNSNPPAGVKWYWQTSDTGTSTLDSGAVINRTIAGNLYLRARNLASPYAWSDASQLVGNIAIITTPPSVPAIATNGDIISDTGGQVPLSVSSVSGATSYKWYTQATGGTSIPGASAVSYSPTIAQTTTYYVESLKENCPSTVRKQVTAYVHPKPVIQSTNNGIISLAKPVILSVGYAYDSYQWQRDSVNINEATDATYETSQTGTYNVIVSKGTATGSISAARLIGAGLSGQNMNYIVSNTILEPGVTTSTMHSLTVNSLSQTIQYFDDLGRPIQTVTTQGSPGKKDIVQPIAYDAFGREAKKYLPYVSTQTSGFYKENALTQQQSFYDPNTVLPGIAADVSPFSETIFEPSPLNRVIKQGLPGSPWQPDNNHTYNSPDHTVKFAYEFNTASEVLLWTYTYPDANNPFGKVNASTGATPVYYPAGQLYKNKTKDEQGHEVIEYKDKQGKVILKKVQADGSTYAQTYYIYDHFDQLRCVIQPEGVARLTTEYFGKSDGEKDTFLTRWAFRYTYDGRRRMATKQVPGAGVVYMVYDKRDRLVLTQDGNQRTKKEWTFTKYDQLNLPVMTGIYTHGDSIGRDAMSALISTSQFAEQYDSTKTHGYTTAVFPTTNLTVHTVTFYDDYTFRDDLIAGDAYDFVSNHLAGQETASFNRVRGLVTGTKTNILGSNNYLWSVSYYDDKYRVIQTVAQNHKDSLDRVTSIYDFTGKVLKTKTTHSTASASTHIARTFIYDHAGRLLKTYHKVNNEDSVLLAQNQYNELGQLVTKKLHARNTDFTQQVDYRYNIRGWLTSINDPAINPNALFNFKLKYNDPTIAGTQAQYNGNISQTSWKTAGSEASSYGYEYDAMNRLTAAAYVNHANPSANDRFNESIKNGSNPGYDLNGNIRYLQRRGKTGATTFGDMDDLEYAYTGNQLFAVTDHTDVAAGFKDGSTDGNDYDYDPNGNLTFDKNKDITLIKYNHLNLPTVVRKSGADSIEYTYDATGRKLRQQVFGATPKTTDYAGEFIYENDTLKLINHEEGRILPDTTTEAQHPWEYQYHLKDHLGNVRVTFSEKSTTTEYLATMEYDVREEEAEDFLNYEDATFNSVSANNHTTGGTYSVRLSGVSSEVVGPAKSLEVNAGDVVDLEVYARYTNLTNTNSNVSTLLTALVSAFDLSSSGSTALTGGDALNSFNTIFSGGPFIGPGDYEDDEDPKAYLNYILFDEAFIPVDFGFDQIREDAATAHEYLSLHVKVKQQGYLYIYLSNEHNKLVDVFFDDFKITHHTAIEQSDDYYAFGLAFNSYNRENSTSNQYLYNGKEKQEELGLDWFDYGMRMYDPSIARWMAVDPLTHKLPNWTPYRYAFNNPIAYTDLRGAIEWPVKGNSAVNKKDYSDGAWSLQNTVVRTSTYNEIRNIGTSPHVGIDYRASIGTQFYSLGDGKVVDIGTQSKGGAKGAKYITVEYSNGDRVSFVHISSTADGIKVGDQVYEGQVLGLTGETGATGRPHLHLTAKDKDGNLIDPENKNYGTVTNEEFFGTYGGDHTKLPGYVNAHGGGETEKAEADVTAKKDKVEVKNANASFWSEFKNQAQRGIGNLDNWLRVLASGGR